MSMHQSKRSVVANCSDIAKVVCDALQFRHQRAQPYSAASDLDAERAFDRAGESDRIGDRAVARRPRRQSRRPIERSAGHQHLDAFVRISQPFLKANDRLAACMKTKMPRLYNASMHRADRNLMQPFSLGSQESVRRNGSGHRCSRAKRREDRPSSVVQPGPRIGRADRLIAEQILYRPLQADRWGMISADGRKLSSLAGQAGDRELAPPSIQQRHMDRAGIAPESGEGQKAIAKLTPKVAPQIAVNRTARPRSALMRSMLTGEDIGQGQDDLFPSQRRRLATC